MIGYSPLTTVAALLGVIVTTPAFVDPTTRLDMRGDDDVLVAQGYGDYQERLPSCYYSGTCAPGSYNRGYGPPPSQYYTRRQPSRYPSYRDYRRVTPEYERGYREYDRYPD